MQELESSGLLTDTDMAEAAHAAEDVAATAPAGSVTVEENHGHVAVGAAFTETATAAAVAAADADVNAAYAAPTADVSEPAEQRTLGQLAGSPAWCKVLDTGSGKAYYWNVDTNEVLWEPPAGVDGDDLMPLRGAAEEGSVGDGGGPAVQTAAAHGGEVAAGEPASEAPAAFIDPSGTIAQQQAADIQERAHTGSSPEAKVAEGQGHTAAAVQPEQAPTAAVGVADAEQQQQRQVPAPQQDIEAVFMTLLHELQAAPAAKQLLQELPEAVKLTLQLQLLHQQWAAFAAQQEAAAAAVATGAEDGQRGKPFTWVQYELHIMQQLQQAVQRLQPAVQELQQHSFNHQHHQKETTEEQQKAAPAGRTEGDEPAENIHTAPQTREDAEEGEVSASDDDMDIDTHQQQPVSSSNSGRTAAAASKPSSGATGNEPKSGYTAAGTYRNTAYMPAWAQPTQHFDFHASYGAYDAGYYDPYAYQHYDAAYAHQYDPLYAQQYSYSSHGSVVAESAVQAPPLPDDVPPPLPDEPAPPGAAEQPPLPSTSPSSDSPTAAATAVAAQKPKRKQYVSQPVLNPAATAGSEDTHGDWTATGLFAAQMATVSVYGSDGREAERSTPPLPAAELPDKAAAEVRKRVREKDSKSAAGSAKPPKVGKMSALFNKWTTVKQQQEEEEAERQRRAELAADPKYQEQKRLEQLEKWRQQQLQAGAAEDNANFTPLAADWRAKLGLSGEGGDATAAASAGTEDAAAKAARKAARKAAKAAARKAAEAGAAAAAGPTVQWPTNSKMKPDLEALSVGLPSGWVAMWDKASGDIYYGNPTTKVCNAVSMICLYF